LTEQRSAAYERLILELAANDPAIKEKLNEQNIIVRDRKITNVVQENIFLTEDCRQLKEMNE
jgi:hypothetical protein